MFKKSNYTGKIIADSSPSGIEKFLKSKMESALGSSVEGVNIRPILKIDDYTDDMSGDVKSGFGAIAMEINGVTLHIPFILKDREFLPFDSIRMGDQQVAYEEGKLKKLVRSIKELKGDLGKSDQFQTMELGDIDDLPFDNGFLGTIMSIRDNAQRSSGAFGDSYTGHNFGHMDEERMMNLASVDVGEVFEDFHEKLADVNRYTEDDLMKVANTVRDKAISDYDDIINAESEKEPDKTTDLLRRQLNNVELVDYRIANNGRHVEFPVVDLGSTTRSSGILFKDVVRGTTKYKNAKKGYNALLMDYKGNFQMIHDKDKILIYKDKRMPDVKLRSGIAHTLSKGMHDYYSLYTNEDNTQVTIPFRITNDYISDKEEDGRIKSFTELTEDGGTFFTAVQSTLFQNVLIANDDLGDYADYDSDFLIVIAREGKSLEPGEISMKEMKEYIRREASNSRDINVSMEMLNRFFVNDKNSIHVLKPKSPVLSFENANIKTISEREELFDFKKTASFEDQNKVRVYINESNYPPTYNVSIRYVVAADAGGLATSNVEQNNINHLTESEVGKVLSDLGYSYTKVDEFVEGAKRSGRYSEFPLENKSLAANYEYKRKSDDKVKRVIRGMVKSTLNARNYLPVMQDVVADSIGGAAKTILDKAASDSLVVATEMEKVANEKRDLFNANAAMLVNIKHNLDKLACDINSGYVTRGGEVFESLSKVANILPEVSQELYYRQYRNTNPLYKEAMLQLDGLRQHILIGDKINKEANFKKRFDSARKSLSKVLTTPKGKKVNLEQKNYNKVVNDLDNLRNERDKLIPRAAVDEGAKKELLDIEGKMEGLMRRRTVASEDMEQAVNALKNQNRGVMTAIGVPTTAFASYKVNEEND